jgi:hypothetical protein
MVLTLVPGGKAGAVKEAISNASFISGANLRFNVTDWTLYIAVAECSTTGETEAGLKNLKALCDQLDKHKVQYESYDRKNPGNSQERLPDTILLRLDRA